MDVRSASPLRPDGLHRGSFVSGHWLGGPSGPLDAALAMLFPEGVREPSLTPLRAEQVQLLVDEAGGKSLEGDGGVRAAVGSALRSGSGSPRSVASDETDIPEGPDWRELLSRFHLGPQPGVELPFVELGQHEPKPIGDWLDCLPAILASFIDSEHEAAAHQDIGQVVELINTIGRAPDITFQRKAFAIRSLMSFVLAYRGCGDFFTRPENRDTILMLPVQKGGALTIQPCVFKEELQLVDGVSAFVFAPADGKGSPVLLLHGTKAWSDAATIPTLRSDLHKNGPGHNIIHDGLARIAPRLSELKREYGEGITVIGHSLGGTVATGFASWRPDLFSQVIAFNPTRASQETYDLRNQLKTLLEDIEELRQQLQQINAGKAITTAMVARIVQDGTGTDLGAAAEVLRAAYAVGQLQNYDGSTVLHLSRILEQWHNIKARYGIQVVPERLPNVVSFVSEFAGTADVVPKFGDKWIGQVAIVASQVGVSGFHRHILHPVLVKGLDIRLLDTAAANAASWRRIGWTLAQKGGATAISGGLDAAAWGLGKVAGAAGAAAGVASGLWERFGW